MGPTWGPSGTARTQVGPILAPWTLLSGLNISQKFLTCEWKCAHFCSRMEHCGIWNKCILGFMKLVYWGNSQSKYDGFAVVVYEILRWMSYHTSKSVQYFTVTSQYGYHFYFQSQSLSLSLSLYIYIYIYLYIYIYISHILRYKFTGSGIKEINCLDISGLQSRCGHIEQSLFYSNLNIDLVNYNQLALSFQFHCHELSISSRVIYHKRPIGKILERFCNDLSVYIPIIDTFIPCNDLWLFTRNEPCRLYNIIAHHSFYSLIDLRQSYAFKVV